MVRTILLALGAALLVTAAASSREPRTPAPRDGGALFREYGCYACHGYAASGGSTGPALAGRGFDIDHIVSYARAPRGVMPPYHEAGLDTAKLVAIARYVTGLPGGRPVAEIAKLARLARKPLGDTIAAAGIAPAQALFATHCAACHGDGGKGGAAPALLEERRARSVEQIAALIRNPPPGMPRLTPDPIAAGEVTEVANYVHGLGQEGLPR